MLTLEQPATQTKPVEPGRAALEAVHTQVWNTGEVSRDFEIIGFMAPFVTARRKSDGVKGIMEFQANPRFYFDFRPTK